MLIGESKVLAIDCSLAGVSGDMLLAGLLGLCESPNQIAEEISVKLSQLLDHPITIKIHPSSYHDFSGYQIRITNELDLKTDQLISYFEKSKSLFNHPTTIHNSINYDKISLECLGRLIKAEQKIHNSQHPQLHELGSTDTVVDIIGIALLLQKHQIEYIQVSKVATGHGTIKTAHGLLPVPAPVTQLLLEESSMPTVKGPSGEALTPTGLSILISLMNNLKSTNSVIWDKSSLGFGTKTWSDRGNYLRCRLGHISKEKSIISMLETNLDDVRPEILGEVVPILMNEGALDVNYYSILMKKNRPGYCLRVLCKLQDETRFAERMMQLTGSLGVRIQQVDRHVGQREIIRVKTKIEFAGEAQEIEFQVKKGKYRFKIEFDDLNSISKQYNIPIFKLEQILTQKYLQRIATDDR